MVRAGLIKNAEDLETRVTEVRRRIPDEDLELSLQNSNKVYAALHETRTVERGGGYSDTNTGGKKKQSRQRAPPYIERIDCHGGIFAIVYQGWNRWEEAEAVGGKSVEQSKQILAEDGYTTLMHLSDLCSISNTAWVKQVRL